VPVTFIWSIRIIKPFIGYNQRVPGKFYQVSLNVFHWHPMEISMVSMATMPTLTKEPIPIDSIVLSSNGASWDTSLLNAKEVLSKIPFHSSSVVVLMTISTSLRVQNQKQQMISWFEIYYEISNGKFHTVK
jgi:hypothetical protein